MISVYAAKFQCDRCGAVSPSSDGVSAYVALVDAPPPPGWSAIKPYALRASGLAVCHLCPECSAGATGEFLAWLSETSEKKEGSGG